MQASATTVYLPRELRAKVARVSDAQGRSASSIIVEAVRFRLGRHEQGTEPLSRRDLARLESRIDKVVRDGALIKETLLLFVRVWLEHNPPLEEHLEASAAASAAARFERFLDYVANSIDSGRSLAHFEPQTSEVEHLNGAAS